MESSVVSLYVSRKAGIEIEKGANNKTAEKRVGHR